MRKRIGGVFGFMGLAAPALFGLAAPAWAQDATSPPAGSKLLLETRGVGVLSYVCAPAPKDMAWVFSGATARLFDANGAEIGEHEKGPIWTLSDGSGVIGQMTAKADAQDTNQAKDENAGPTLLFKVTQHVGDAGALSNAAYVRRVATTGGRAPAAGCDETHKGEIARAEYSAIYQFFSR